MNIDQLNLAVLVGEKYRKIKAKYLLKIAEPSPKNYISRQKLQNILQPYQAFLPINAKMSKLQYRSLKSVRPCWHSTLEPKQIKVAFCYSVPFFTTYFTTDVYRPHAVCFISNDWNIEISSRVIWPPNIFNNICSILTSEMSLEIEQKLSS